MIRAGDTTVALDDRLNSYLNAYQRNEMKFNQLRDSICIDLLTFTDVSELIDTVETLYDYFFESEAVGQLEES